MSDLNSEILSTLALNYAESGAGLELVELHKYLHRNGNNGRRPTLIEITKALYELRKIGLVFEHENVFSVASCSDAGKPACNASQTRSRYGVSGERSDAGRQKEKRAEMSKEKIARLRTPLKWLPGLPFFKAIAITRSVAMNSATKSTDLDLLIIVKSGRIWTTRILAMIVTQFFGKRRYGKKITDRICLNYFIADGMKAPTQNIASANMLASARPILGKENFAAFISRNRWMEKFLYQCHDAEAIAPIQISYPSKTSIVLGKLLGGKFGDWMECLLKKWQTARIKRKLAGKTDTDQLIFTDDILMLHYPESKNTRVMKRYSDKIKELGVTNQEL